MSTSPAMSLGSASSRVSGRRVFLVSAFMIPPICDWMLGAGAPPLMALYAGARTLPRTDKGKHAPCQEARGQVTARRKIVKRLGNNRPPARGPLSFRGGGVARRVL